MTVGHDTIHTSPSLIPRCCHGNDITGPFRLWTSSAPQLVIGGGDAVLWQIIQPCRHKASSSDKGQEKVAGLILDKDAHFMANPSYIYIMEM